MRGRPLIVADLGRDNAAIVALGALARTRHGDCADTSTESSFALLGVGALAKDIALGKEELASSNRRSAFGVPRSCFR